MAVTAERSNLTDASPRAVAMSSEPTGSTSKIGSFLITPPGPFSRPEILREFLQRVEELPDCVQKDYLRELYQFALKKSEEVVRAGK